VLLYAVLLLLLLDCAAFQSQSHWHDWGRSLTSGDRRGTRNPTLYDGPQISIVPVPVPVPVAVAVAGAGAGAVPEKKGIVLSEAHFFDVEHPPTSFDQASWESARDFLYFFGLEYESKSGLLYGKYGIYAERRHYPLKIAIRMNAVQDLFMGDSDQLCVATRKFVELCVGIFAPKEGWGLGERPMAGELLKKLRKIYESQKAPRFLEFLDILNRLNGISKLGLHEHVDMDEAELTPLKRAQLVDGVYQAALYVKDNIQLLSIWAKDTKRAHRLMGEREREREEREETEAEAGGLRESARDPTPVLVGVSPAGLLQVAVADRRRAALEQGAAWVAAERERLIAEALADVERELVISSRLHVEGLMEGLELWERGEQEKIQLEEEREREEEREEEIVGLEREESQARPREKREKDKREKEKQRERERQKKLGSGRSKRKEVKKQKREGVAPTLKRESREGVEAPWLDIDKQVDLSAFVRANHDDVWAFTKGAERAHKLNAQMVEEMFNLSGGRAAYQELYLYTQRVDRELLPRPRPFSERLILSEKREFNRELVGTFTRLLLDAGASLSTTETFREAYWNVIAANRKARVNYREMGLDEGTDEFYNFSSWIGSIGKTILEGELSYEEDDYGSMNKYIMKNAL